MGKPLQLDLIDRTPGRTPHQPESPALPEARYKLLHACGYEVGHVKTLAYPLNDSRAGFEPIGGGVVDHRRLIRCPHCEAMIRDSGSVHVVRD